MQRDYRHLDIARLASYHSNATSFKLGAVIAKGKRVIGIGFNNVRKTHPSSNTPYQKIHAEFAAILNANGANLQGSTIYVYREGKKGKQLISKPCPNCQKLILAAGIKYVIYTSPSGYQKISTKELCSDYV